MKRNVKVTYCAVLLVLSLTIASSAFGADMKTTNVSNVILGSDPSEGYAGFAQALSADITSAETSEVIVGLDPNEGYSGLAVFKSGDAPLMAGSNVILNSAPTEAYSGFNTPSAVVSGSSDVMASSSRGNGYQR